MGGYQIKILVPSESTLNIIRCRIRIGMQKGTIILTTTHIEGRADAPRRLGTAGTVEAARAASGFEGFWKSLFANHLQRDNVVQHAATSSCCEATRGDVPIAAEAEATEATPLEAAQRPSLRRKFLHLGRLPGSQTPRLHEAFLSSFSVSSCFPSALLPSSPSSESQPFSCAVLRVKEDFSQARAGSGAAA